MRNLYNALQPLVENPMRQPQPVGMRSRDKIFKLAPGLAATEALFDSLSDVLFCVKDPAKLYVAANGAFVRAAGLRSRAELLGRSASGLFPPALAAGYEQQDEAVLSSGEAVQNRLEMVTRPDGAIGWFMSQKVPVRDAGGQIVAIAGISRDLSTSAEKGATLNPLATALAALQKDFAGPLRVMELAATVGLSVSQFERRMREYTGLTPRQLLTKARIEAAAKALRSTDQMLGAIAIDYGFYDQASFTRQFRAATGTTPGDYRQAFRDGPRA
jgi:PAS domain S-box-containing protein